ncbi:MAG: hypothetical protein KatS3mg076_2439 [Candidatus Binatia bacterium]|nr:MAG: hypothetical protein KatS3mg076_2439 [Candidatus Binatia bacterium]
MPQPLLPAHEAEVATQLEQELLQTADEGLLELALGILVLEAQELEDVGILDLLLDRDLVARRRAGAFAKHGRLVARERGALVKLALDLPFELADRPAAAQRFGFVEAPCLVALEREQADVGRPGEWKAPGQLRQSRNRRRHLRLSMRVRRILGPLRFRRQRLQNLRVAGFARQRLANPIGRIGEVELPHLLEVLARKSPAEAAREIVRQAFDRRRPIASPRASALLVLHDAPADLPVRRRHQCVDGASGRPPGLLEKIYDPADQGFVRGRRAVARRGGLSGTDKGSFAAAPGHDSTSRKSFASPSVISFSIASTSRISSAGSSSGTGSATRGL